MKLFLRTAFIQGTYYCLIGLWPLIHPGSFIEVAEIKNDLWMAKIIGLLLMVIGVVLLYAWYHLQNANSLVLLGMASTMVCSGSDLYYFLNRVLPDVYLIDAMIQAALFNVWCIYAFSKSKYK